MNAYTFVESYNQYGGHATISILGDLIEHRLGHIDHGVVHFESIACFRAQVGPRPTLERRWAEFRESLTRLPTSRWEAKKSRLVVRYESSLGFAGEVLNDRRVSVGLLRRALGELTSVIETLVPKLRRKKGLDIVLFLQGLKELSADIPSSADDLVSFHEGHSARRREQMATLPWDQRLEIDWADYHPDSRHLLDDPFFWSNTDDYAPHGNDTGADLLPDFRRWNTRNSDVDGWKFLLQLFKSWGMQEEILQFRAKELSQYSKVDDIAMTTHDEAVIALAFAEIKIRGRCSSRIAAEALHSSHRQVNPAVTEKMGWPLPSAERIQASRRIEKALQQFLD